MKNILLPVLFCLFRFSLMGQQGFIKFPVPAGTQTITTADTVVFDISAATYAAGYIDFPVKMLTDDTIYSLDFSFRYDHNALLFDTIFDLTGYCQVFSYYNTADSTLRFTSNSFQPYTNDTVLFSIRFQLSGGAVSSLNFNTVKGLLNGDQCSIKLVDPSLSATSELIQLPNVSAYPNPFTAVFTIDPLPGILFNYHRIYNADGRCIFSAAGSAGTFDLSEAPPGVYTLHSVTDKGVFITRLVKQ